MDKDKRLSVLYVQGSEHIKDLLKKVIEIKSNEFGTQFTAGQTLEIILTEVVRKNS